MALNIAILTYKRAHLLVGKDYFGTAKYVLPESQRDDYKKVLPAKRMVVIPDKFDGSAVKKRNWILQNMPRPLLMLDDDVKHLMTTVGIVKDGKRRSKVVVLTPEEAMGVIIDGFNLAEQFDCKLWGINVNTDGKNYQQYKPFSLTQVVLGPFMGHLKHKLLYDERLWVKHDYDMSLQALCKYKKILRLNRFAYECKHGDNEGGLVAMRTMEKEVECCRAVERKWGRKIIRYPLKPKKMAELLNGKTNIPIKGV